MLSTFSYTSRLFVFFLQKKSIYKFQKFSLWSIQIFGGCGKRRILVKVNWMDKRRGQIQMRDKSIHSVCHIPPQVESLQGKNMDIQHSFGACVSEQR